MPPNIYHLTTGGFALKKQMLDDRRFPKMHLDLQRLLQVLFQMIKTRLLFYSILGYLVKFHTLVNLDI